jgi:hypothetical protein
MKSWSGFYLSERFSNLDYSVRGRAVNLYLNGDYRGVYFLCDQIEETRLGLETPNALLAGQSDYPFLVNISLDNDRFATGANDLFYVSDFFMGESFGYNGKVVTSETGNIGDIKYPSQPKGVGGADFGRGYISNYVNAVFTAMRNRDCAEFERLVDVDCFLDFLILYELMYNQDNIMKSFWCYKRVGEKMKFVVWDFDSGLGKWYWDKPDNTGDDAPLAFRLGVLNESFGKGFLKMSENFYTRLVNRFRELEPVYSETWDDEAREYKSFLAEAGERNRKKW